MRNKKKLKQRGFSLVEIVVAVAIFAILATGALGVFGALTKSVKVARERTVLSSLAAGRLEIVRNLPYGEIGTASGNPNGTLPDSSNPIVVTIEGVSYHVYYEVTYVDDSADGTILAGTDPAPNDYKQVKMFVRNTVTNVSTTFLTTVSPKGLEGISNAGALFIQVFDSVGQPVSGASIHIEKTDSSIVLDRTSGSDGVWIEVGLPAGNNAYEISVTKSGYSTDQTSPITVANPNPTKPDSTIVVGVVTQISFSIDAVANLTIKTVNTTCQSISGVDINVRGSKLIGTSPDVYKFNQDYTTSGGQTSLSGIEWDNYIPALQATEPSIIYGTSPVQQVSVLPGSNQTFTFVLGPSSAHSLRVIVKDAGTGAALEGATVHLQRIGSPPDDFYAVTGGSVWSQVDWSGGLGQADFSDTTRYFVDDGNIDVATAPVGVRLKRVSGDYTSSGELESSTFDTGDISDFTTLVWEPTSQNISTTLKFQIASNTDNTTWGYKGPDGTSATYYTVPGTSIHASHNNDRYIRYKAFLSTTDNQQTPVLTTLSLNYVSGCFTPGQVIFPDLTQGNNYDLDISLSGYQTQTVNNVDINGNQVLEILLNQ